MDHCVTDDAAVHILVHVCGQMWTLEQYYDSINMLSATRHEMFHLYHIRYDFKLYLFVTFDRFELFDCPM